MNREFRKRITQNLTYLKERLVDLDPIIDQLIEKDVIQLEQRLKIEQVSPPTPQKKFNEFIQILLSSPEPNAYNVFIEALYEERHFHIVDRLQNCQIKETYGGPRYSNPPIAARHIQRSTTNMLCHHEEVGASGGGRHVNSSVQADQMATVMTRVLNDFGGKLAEELASTFEKNRRSDMLEMEKRMEEKLQDFKLDWEHEKEDLLKRNEKAINGLRESFERLRRSNDELARLREKYDNLKQLQKEMREKENERWQRLATTNTQNVQLRERNELLEGEIKNLEDKMAALKSQNNILKNSEEQSRLELEHMTLTNKTMMDELAEKEKEIDELKKELKKSCNEIQEMMSRQKDETKKPEDDAYINVLEQQNEKLDEIFQAVNALGTKEKRLFLKQPANLYVSGNPVHRNQRPTTTKPGHQHKEKGANND